MDNQNNNTTKIFIVSVIVGVVLMYASRYLLGLILAQNTAFIISWVIGAVGIFVTGAIMRKKDN